MEHLFLALLGQNQSNDKAVQTQSLSENEDQNHADEELGLLAVGANTSITNNANGEASSKGTQTTRQTSGKVSIAVVSGVLVLATGD